MGEIETTQPTVEATSYSVRVPIIRTDFLVIDTFDVDDAYRKALEALLEEAQGRPGRITIQIDAKWHVVTGSWEAI